MNVDLRATANSDATDTVACAHCDLPVPEGLVRRDGPSYCCVACESVRSIIEGLGLEQYYALRERLPGDRRSAVQLARDFAEFDDPEFSQASQSSAPNGRRRIELYLEGVHCAACIWLVERVPQLLPGVRSVRLDLGRSRAVIEWDPEEVALSEIAQQLNRLGYPPHPFHGVEAERAAQRERRDLWIRLAITGAVAGNVMMISFALYGGQFHGIDHSLHQTLRWVSLAVSVPSLIWGGGWFFRGAARALRQHRLHIDLPVSLGILAGFGHGAWNVMRGSGEIYLDSVTMLIFLLLGGRLLERGQQRRAAEAAELFHSLSPSQARRIDTGPSGEEQERSVPASSLTPGRRIRVHAGETIPADGVLSRGRSDVDRSLLTGESIPVPIAVGDAVEAGCTNLGAPIEVRVEKTGDESRLGKILASMEESARRRAPIVRLADRLSGSFIAGVLIAASITAVTTWHLDPVTAIDRTLALLIVTCPCALALATPLAVSVALGRAARRGILIKGGDVFERLRKPGVIWFDKTGTLTAGEMQRTDWIGPSELEAAVAALEEGNQHPLAQAFTAGYRERAPETELPEPTEVTRLPRGGLRGVVDGAELIVGSPAAVLEATGADTESPLLATARERAKEGETPVLVARDGMIEGLAFFSDALHEDAETMVDAWRREGWQVGILSGDDPAVARAVGASLGIAPERCLGGITPEGKLAQIEEDVASDTPTVMVGDGVNDAAALAAATVGVALGGGAEAALRAADVFCLERRLSGVAELLHGAARVLTTIRLNFAFSLSYNVIGATLAIAGILSPLLAAIAMPLSSLTVVTVSLQRHSFSAKEPQGTREVSAPVKKDSIDGGELAPCP